MRVPRQFVTRAVHKRGRTPRLHEARGISPRSWESVGRPEGTRRPRTGLAVLRLEGNQDKKGPKKSKCAPERRPLRLKQEDQKSKRQGRWGTWAIGAPKFPTKGTKKTQEDPSKKTHKRTKSRMGRSGPRPERPEALHPRLHFEQEKGGPRLSWPGALFSKRGTHRQ